MTMLLARPPTRHMCTPQAALLVTLYNREPILHLPHRVLALLTEIDEMFALWRHR